MNIIGENQEAQILSRKVTILDKNVAEFSLEKIRNCSIIDAYKIYYWKTKYCSDFCKLYWKNLLSYSEKYIQCIRIRERWKNYILMENVVASYLRKIQNVKFNDDWMYVGYHQFSGYRVIVGHGDGIILSRFISDDIFREVENTKLYIRRLDIYKLKIFSTLEDWDNAKYINLNDVFDFVNNNEYIQPIFSKNYKILDSLFYVVILGLTIFLVNIVNDIRYYNSQSFQRCSKIESDAVKIKIVDNNYEQIIQLLTNMQNNIDFLKIENFCKKYNLKVKELEIDKNAAKIKVNISLKDLGKIKEAKSDYIPIYNFEDFDNSKIVETNLWLDLK